ncbi:MAG: hypothetical protein B7Z72_15295, partial [Gemmatimonadetes bacterium 21-71-4]
ELVENALDAGARSIDIEIEEGGRQRIRVGDDGVGMGREDAVLALARHATSKIRAAADLVGVASYGFRGEALPAICSVSQLEIETAPVDGGGTRVRAAAGAVEDTREAARRRGTTVTVAHLFYNAPARHKFMRGARSEWRAIMEAVTSVALTRRDVRLSLTHDGKEVLTLPAASSLRARLAALWGGAYAERFLAVDDVRGTTRVSGLVERPADVGTASRRIYVSVNGRAVRDFGIVRAAEAAYQSTIPSGVRPTLFLDFEVARRALGTIGAGAAIGRPTIPFPAAPRYEPPGVDVEALRADRRPREGLFAPSEAGEGTAPAPTPGPADAPTRPESGPEDAEPIPFLMQVNRTYLLFESEGGVVLIDQHSAHERILYEKFMGALTRGEAPG